MVVGMIKNFTFISKGICGICLTLSLFSCSPFTVPDRSTSPPDLPERFSLGDVGATPEQRWWLGFSSPQLNTLIDAALAGNLSLRAQWARLEKAQAKAVQAGSTLYPSLSGDASASYAKTDSDSGGSSEERSYSLGLAASYELDLWGRVRAGRIAADLNAAASREDLHAAAMTVAAEVATRWIALIAAQEEKDLLLKQLATNQTYLELVELRFQKSLASALDVMQQRQLVKRVQAQIPLIEMQERILHNELAVLTGRMPQELPDLSRETLPFLHDPPAGGVPAELLKNRPDIRAALNRLQAADQDLVVAQADRLPAIRLTGSAGYKGSEADHIFDNWLLNLAAGLTAPLLDGGRRRAEVEISTATVREQLSLYREVVITAVKEVEESLIREEKTREHIMQTEKQLDAAETALTEARARYVNGLIDYLPVLTQLLSVQGLEIDLVARNQDLLGARISLYRALGGTWADTLPPPGENLEKQQDKQS